MKFVSGGSEQHFEFVAKAYTVVPGARCAHSLLFNHARKLQNGAKMFGFQRIGWIQDALFLCLRWRSPYPLHILLSKRKHCVAIPSSFKYTLSLTMASNNVTADIDVNLIVDDDSLWEQFLSMLIMFFFACISFGFVGLCAYCTFKACLGDYRKSVSDIFGVQKPDVNDSTRNSAEPVADFGAQVAALFNKNWSKVRVSVSTRLVFSLFHTHTHIDTLYCVPCSVTDNVYLVPRVLRKCMLP